MIFQVQVGLLSLVRLSTNSTFTMSLNCDTTLLSSKKEKDFNCNMRKNHFTGIKFNASCQTVMARAYFAFHGRNF